MWQVIAAACGVILICLIAVYARSEQPRDEVWIMHKDRRGEKER